MCELEINTDPRDYHRCRQEEERRRAAERVGFVCRCKIGVLWLPDDVNARCSICGDLLANAVPFPIG